MMEDVYSIITLVLLQVLKKQAAMHLGTGSSEQKRIGNDRSGDINAGSDTYGHASAEAVYILP